MEIDLTPFSLIAGVIGLLLLAGILASWFLPLVVRERQALAAAGFWRCAPHDPFDMTPLRTVDLPGRPTAGSLRIPLGVGLLVADNFALLGLKGHVDGVLAGWVAAGGLTGLIVALWLLAPVLPEHATIQGDECES